MADTKEAETVEAMTEYPNRLQMSMLAPVKKIAAMIPDGDKEVYVIGYVFGEARGVSFRNNPNSTDGTAAEALTGVFEGTPAYADMPWMEENDKCKHRARLASAVCFLPPSAQSAVVKAVLGDHEKPTDVKRGKRVDQLGVAVPISVEVGIRKNSGEGGVGYEWVVRGLAKVTAESPIERMRKQLGVNSAADLARIVDAADKGPAPQLAAPGKSAKKASASKRKR